MSAGVDVGRRASRRITGAFWPTADDRLLLRAAAMPDERGLEAWREVRPRLDIDTLHGDAVRLLPLVSRNLTALGVDDDPLLPRLKGLYRHAWYANQVLLHAVAGVLRDLEAAGVPTLVLKGTPLALAWYRDLGARPMSDVDVLVPYRQRLEAVGLLERRGWRREKPDVPLSELLAGQHGVGFVGPDGRMCDLHWQLLMELVVPGDEPGSTDDFWAASVPLDVLDVATRALCPADQLLHVCLHGARWDSNATVRWAVDAAVVVRSAGDELDWRRLVEQAAKRDCLLRVRDAMTFLVEVLDVAVPPEVVSDLQGVTTTRREEFAHRRTGRRRRDADVLGAFPRTVAEYARASADWGVVRTVVQFPGYLRDGWRLDHTWQVPVRAAQKAVRRVRARRRARRA